MMKTVKIKNVVLGGGPTKILASFMPKSAEEAQALAPAFLAAFERGELDVLEWRIDHWAFGGSLVQGRTQPAAAHCTEALLSAARAVRALFPEKPLLATLRTAAEGGLADIDGGAYAAALAALIRADDGAGRPLFDALDVEFTQNADAVKRLLDDARARGICSILSIHDFEGTPKAENIGFCLKAMASMTPDVVKIALMPKKPQDVLALLTASLAFSQTAAVPLIAVSMGALGAASRISGGVFGSCATFGALEQTSAPGQIEIGLLRRLLCAQTS